ncbi:MAG: amidase [Acidimicrobiia bacterium]
MNLPEYDTHDAVGLAGLVAAGDVKPVDLVEAALDRIERRNPKLNAVIRNDSDRALAAAREPVAAEAPFGGVPFLLKDLALEEGERTTFGSVFFRDFVAEDTSVLVRRMRSAGLISVGRTNTPEFGLLPTTEPVLWGATANPWDLAYSPGGSSGGAAAAVAAGIVPLAHGGDGGGSIRIPAANCGIFGLKPSRGRLPQYPPAPSDFLAVGGCVSRSVRDTAVFLDATAGAVPGSRWSLAAPPKPFRDAAATDPAPLRVAMLGTDLHGGPLHAECAAALRVTSALLEDLGHHVTEVRPRFDAEAMEDAFLVVWAALAASIFQLILAEAETRRGGRFVRRRLGDWRAMQLITRLDRRKSGLDSFEPFTWGLARRSRQRKPADLMTADTTLQAASFALHEMMRDYDLLLTPTLGTPPVRTGQIDQSAEWDDLDRTLRRYVPFTPIANFTGRPAMSVPLHWTDAGLPIGSHFIGGEGDDATLLAIAGQLERAMPWWDRRPPIASS